MHPGLREIHRASECALQWLQRPISSLGEANLVSPRDFQKVNPLIICALTKINSRGEFHEVFRQHSRSCEGAVDGFTKSLDSFPAAAQEAVDGFMKQQNCNASKVRLRKGGCEAGG